ncbi:MAG: hypothetical protein AAF620_13380 [Bacteroidota bacterium]
MSTDTNQNAFWNRNDFKIIFGYLVGSWTLLEFMNYSLERLNISPVWTEVFLKTVLMLIPTILVIALIPKGVNKFLRMIKKIIPPLNVIMILLVLIISFWGRELGTMTKDVNFYDENGNLVSTSVLKEEFTISVMMPPFEYSEEQKDLSNAWIGNGLLSALQLNLSQFHFIKIDAQPPNKPYQERTYILKNFGDYLLDGSYNIKNDSIWIHAILYSKNRKVVVEKKFSAISLIDASDLLKKMVLENVKLPPRIDYIDIPLKELTTKDEEAASLFFRGRYYEAISRDSEFAFAYFLEMDRCLSKGLRGPFLEKLAKTGIKHINKLPLRHHAIYRSLYYQAIGHHDKSIKSYENNLKLNPGDERALWSYIHALTINEYYEEAVDLAVQDLERKLLRSTVTDIAGTLMLLSGKLDKLESIVSQIEFIAPKAAINIVRANIELTRKNYQRARALYNEALIDEPLFYTIDSLIKVCDFLDVTAVDSISKWSNNLKGVYLKENSDGVIEIKSNGNQLIFLPPNNFPIIGHFIAPNKCHFTREPYFNLQYQLYLEYENETNSILKRQQSQSNRKTQVEYYYRLTPELSGGLSAMKEMNYNVADSLFSMVVRENNDYYFVNEYLDAIEYVDSEMSDQIKLELTGKSFWLDDQKDQYFTFSVEEYQLVGLPNYGEIWPLYPQEGAWLFNGFERSIKYHLITEGTELSLEVYKYNHESNQYEFEFLAKERIFIQRNL